MLCSACWQPRLEMEVLAAAASKGLVEAERPQALRRAHLCTATVAPLNQRLGQWGKPAWAFLMGWADWRMGCWDSAWGNCRVLKLVSKATWWLWVSFSSIFPGVLWHWSSLASSQNTILTLLESNCCRGWGMPISSDQYYWKLKRSGFTRHWSYHFLVFAYRVVWICWMAKNTAGSPDADSTPTVSPWDNVSLGELESCGKHACKQL